MNISTWGAAGLALTLAGCAMHGYHPDGVPKTGADPAHNPVVSIKGGVISVGPDPLVFTRDEGAVAITWHLPRGYAFADKGIEIDGRVIERNKLGGAAAIDAQQNEIVCADKGGGRTYTCVNRNSVRGASYKYTIRVRQDGKDLPPRDPEIWNLN